jgi:hypothetical protein
MKIKKEYLISGVVVFLVAIGAFLIGMQVGRRSRITNGVAFGVEQRQGSRGQNQAATTSPTGFQQRNGGAFSGEVTALDGDTITVKMADGSSKIVILSENTLYQKTAEASKSDLAVGMELSVFGETGTDGSVTASTVTLGGGLQLGAGMPPAAAGNSPRE